MYLEREIKLRALADLLADVRPTIKELARVTGVAQESARLWVNIQTRNYPKATPQKARKTP